MKRLAGLLLITLAAILSPAQIPDCAALTQQALEITGINQQIDLMQQMLTSDDYLAQITANQPNGPEFAAIFKPIIRKDLDASSLKKELFRRVVARCKPAEMSQAVAEMKTDLVARMLELQAAQRTPEGQEQIKSYVRVIQIAPPPDSQLDAADVLDRKAGLTDFSVNTLLAVTRGILKGAGAPDDVLMRLQEGRKQIKAQLQGPVLASILLTYKGVSKPDMAKYGEELSTGPLRWYYDAVHQSFVEILGERAEAIGQDIKSAAIAKKD